MNEDAAGRPGPRPMHRGASAARRSWAADEAYVVTSPHLAAGPLHRGHRTAVPRREALILQAALNHPWLMHDRLEEFAETEFRHADAKKLKAALIDVLAHQFGHDAGQESGPGASRN